MKANGILIVDDDPKVRKILSDILTRGGYEPVKAATETEALAALRREKPGIAVALIDLRLDDVSGLEVMKKIKEISPDTECIILTGHASQETAIEAMNLGAYSYVQKSFEMESLLLTIHRARDKRNAERALRESEENYRSLASTADLMYLVDRNCRYLFMNEGYRARRGVPLEEIIGKTYGDFHPKEKTRDFALKVAKIFETGTPVQYESEGKDDEWFLKTLSPVKDQKGRTRAVTTVSKDITAQKKVEKALRESEARYRSVFEGTNTPTLIIEEDTTISMVNTAFEKMFGYSKGEVEGRMYWTDFVTPRDSERLKTYHEKRRMGRRGVPSEYEASFFDKAGNVREALLTVGIIPGTRRSVCSLMDITESKRAEIALRESEERYRTILDAIEEGYFESDLSGRYTFVNDAMCRILGYKRDELLTMDNRDHSDPEGAKRVYALFNELYQTGQPIEIDDYEFYKKNRKRGVLEEKAFVMRDPEGRPVGFKGVVRDVTERKEAERALKESEEQYRALFDNNPIETIIVDREARVTGYNLAKKMSGGRLPTIGQDVMYKDYAAKHTTDMLKELRECISSGISKEFLEQEYRDRLLDIKIAPFSEGAIITTIDATSRKQAEVQQKNLESQLQQAQKMKAIGTLAGGLAHDFNNLLMGIQGNASLLLLDMDSTHPYYEKLRNIEQYVRDGAELTGQLLGFARGGKYEVKPTDLNKLVKKSSGMFGRTKKEIKIYKKYQQDIWMVEADQGQIEQTLLNIYVNAWQAMPGGGEIYLQTENVVLDDHYLQPYNFAPGNYVKISVTDTGTGMDEETVKRVFDPFFTTKEMGRGTGLGMASAYGIIKNHNGIITVYSEEGIGTTFNIYLPALDAAISDEEPVTKKEQPLMGHETILLVDDEELIIDVGGEILKFLGYTVHLARSGKEAVEIYKEKRKEINLVILDMIMPDLGGGETYDILRKMNPRIKVLLSSGYSINGQAREILEKGCDGFIQKPFSIEQLSQKIRELLEE
ncbi:MAG: PAS domain S-box protein [Deltaproteobacteria bacterium]|nr:PAS domain S-box protein [Deltaproteobacteria bacterium]